VKIIVQDVFAARRASPSLLIPSDAVRTAATASAPARARHVVADRDRGGQRHRCWISRLEKLKFTIEAPIPCIRDARPAHWASAGGVTSRLRSLNDLPPPLHFHTVAFAEKAAVLDQHQAADLDVGATALEAQERPAPPSSRRPPGRLRASRTRQVGKATGESHQGNENSPKSLQWAEPFR